jgi:hypothetical protein
MFVLVSSNARLALGVLALAVLATSASCVTADKEGDQLQRERASLGKTPAFNVDLAQTSASGISSGGYMAVQFGVAFSSIVKGVGVFAGGPFTCSGGSVGNALGRCMSRTSPLDPAPFVATTTQYASIGAIDPVATIATQRVFLFGGSDDATVSPAVMDGLRDYYFALGVPSPALAFERRRPGTAHTMPTLDYGGSCGMTASPYLGKCGYDGAGQALAHIYGPLAPPVSTPTGTFIEIPQKDFIANPGAHSLADTGYAYVPTSCSSGETCRIHVAFHGCLQSVSKVGDAFYKHAGYNQWADNNHLIIVYPQTITTFGSNPNGCWDWWGYDSAEYAKKSGPQLKMTRAIVDRLAGGSPAPIDAGAPPADAGTPPPYAGTVESDAATDGGIEESAASCIAASNTEHIAAGRAYPAYGYAFAMGSSQPLGPALPWTRTGLTRVAAGVYVIGACW